MEFRLGLLVSNDNIKKIVQSELFNASNYLERIMIVLDKVENLSKLKTINKLSIQLDYDLYEFLDEFTLLEDFTQNNVKDLSVGDSFFKAFDNMRRITKIIDLLLELNLNKEKSLVAGTNLINLIFSHAFLFHNKLIENSQVEIEYPRVNLCQSKRENENSPIQFHLPLEKIMQIQEENLGNIEFIGDRRKERYDEFLNLGHQAMFDKDGSLALTHFKKARTFNENAEILTLIGWAHSQNQEIEEAKKCCLDAIKKDSNYGPPYNDLGSYLLEEGKIEEAIKWFSLAKKATYYQNREYPYINSGRAYMSLKQYRKALSEFKTAISLAPQHDDLQQMITKIQDLLNKSDKKDNLTSLF